MNTVDDFRRSLERHATLAPDATGIIEQAHTGAVRIRRRRRIMTTVLAAATAAVVAAAVPVVTRLQSAQPSAGPVGVRAPYEMTVDVAAETGFTVETRTADATRQFLSVRQIGREATDFPATVWVYDPGTFDSKALPKGKKVRVGGHDAWQLTALTPDGPAPVARRSLPPGGDPVHEANAALVWREPSGSWVTVTGAHNVFSLFKLAEAIRFGDPAPPKGPVGLSWLPDGLEVTFAETMASFPWMTARIALNPAQRGPVDSPMQDQQGPNPPASPIEISIEPRDFNQWNMGTEKAAPTGTIAGHRVWFSDGRIPDVTHGPKDLRLSVETESCGIRIQVADRAKATYADLERLVEGATFGSCTDPAGWVPVVS